MRLQRGERTGGRQAWGGVKGLSETTGDSCEIETERKRERGSCNINLYKLEIFSFVCEDLCIYLSVYL